MSNRFVRLREKVEKMVFAGLKPDAPAPASAGLITWRQKAGVVFALLATGGFTYFLVTALQRPAEQGESKAAAPAPIQIIAPGVKIEKNKDLEVVQIEFHKNANPKSITGTLRNRTDKTFARCEVSFDVTTKEGAQLGGASTVVHNVGPHAEVKFRLEVPERAGFALVRELRTD